MTPMSVGELLVKLAETVRRLCAALSPEAVFLYGSYACGTPNRHSDLDLLLVVASSGDDPYGRDERENKILRHNGVGQAVPAGLDKGPPSDG